MSVIFYGCITLDGYLADKNHGLEWLFQSGDVEETGYTDFYNSINITVMGKNTFNEIAKLEHPHEAYPTTNNYVFTHDKKFECEGFITVQGNIVDFVRNIDRSKNIWVVGGNTLFAPLLDENLIDTLIIQIAPVILGEGIPLFTQKEQIIRYKLTEVNQYNQFAEIVYNKE